MDSKPNTTERDKTKEEMKDVWCWSTNLGTSETAHTESDMNIPSHVKDVITKAQWDNGSWNVVIGRQINPKNDNESSISFQTGIREEDFVKFVVWDGSKGESFNQLNDELLPHYDFILLPEINVYPKDVYIWSGGLAAGALLFLFVEQRLYTNTNINKKREWRFLSWTR